MVIMESHERAVPIIGIAEPLKLCRYRLRKLRVSEHIRDSFRICLKAIPGQPPGSPGFLCRFAQIAVEIPKFTGNLKSLQPAAFCNLHIGGEGSAIQEFIYPPCGIRPEDNLCRHAILGRSPGSDMNPVLREPCGYILAVRVNTESAHIL